MAKLISKSSISLAWLEAMEHLKTSGGTEANLIVAIAPGAEDNALIRELIDAFLKTYESSNVRRIRKVADTIFPVDFYHPPAGMEARERLYENQYYARRIESRSIPCGTYFDRLIDYPGAKAPNQLERKIRRLKNDWECGKRNGNAYELALGKVPEDGEIESNRTTGSDLRIYNPDKDNFVMGFPCLSHISLTLFKGRLDMTALYRNQYFMTKAYGNYIGLLDLLNFICQEVGCSTGELVCIAAHADAEFNSKELHKADICRLIDDCRSAVGDD